MKIFITGATGFIGKHLTRRLVEDGHEVGCLVRKTSAADPLSEMGVKLFYGDVNDRETLLEGMTGCDWLFHLANLYSMWEPDAHLFERVNVDGTRTVLDCALQAGVKKVVYVSTAAVYGKPAVIPFCEESLPGPRLFSAYARSKAAAVRLAWDFSRQTGLPLVVLYPGIVLGPGDDKASGEYIRGLVNRRLPSTIFHHSRATYVAVEDVAQALVRAAELAHTVGQKYLIGRANLSGSEFTGLIQAISEVRLPLFRFPDWMVTTAAYLFTGLARITGRPPLWGLSVDAAHTLKNGFTFDGSKAVRELDLQYHPIEGALCDAIASYRNAPNGHHGSGSELYLRFQNNARRTASAPVRVLDKEMEHQDG